MEADTLPGRRRLPKLMACMTQNSLENLRNRALFSLDALDAKGIRRRKLPLHECLILELRESGYSESSDYLQDLIYDNIQLLAEDDIGIVVDLRKKEDYLEHISSCLIKAEKYRDKENTKKECLELLSLALYYSEKGKGILWLAEKFFLASIAVSSQYLIDGGRQKGCCKYHYACFLLDKFPGADPEEPFVILTEVRDCAIGKDWLLIESDEGGDVSSETVFSATAIQLHRVLLSKARLSRDVDPAKSERLSRLAERRARDAKDTPKIAEAIIEIGVSQLMMNNLNNAHKTFLRALQIYEQSGDVKGLCETKMHLAAVMQRLGEHETAAKLLTEMGALAMEHGLRRQLGRALHLLGELHLRRERPELGTQHLTEAFQCFMGLNWQNPKQNIVKKDKETSSELDVIYKTDTIEIYEEEAEQSRLMMAISAGQELMAAFFNLIRESGKCSVAKLKMIEWKLARSGWWVTKQHHQLVPCICPVHNRTPLDVLQFHLANKNLMMANSDAEALLGRIDTVEDIRKLRSSIS
ncbi:uncharacterized protein LOC113397581 [Vanessa tameamea]|uniref:Tetratricopeptide repeat protein 29 n=1 Tax=Vanessa tameamea TaxID=334116 RepID=A0A8B8I3X1_VANTA